MISLSLSQFAAIFAVIVIIAVVAAWAISLARRIDRLHQRILAERATLSRLLVRQASEVSLLIKAAPRARHLSACERAASDSLRATSDEVSADGLGRPGGNGSADRVEVERRLGYASALSAAMRAELTAQMRLQLESNEACRTRLEAVDSTCYRIQLTRSMHNLDVENVRRLRAKRIVRLLHLAGFAAMPEVIEFDDGSAPEEDEV